MDEFALAFSRLGETLPQVWVQGLPSAREVLRRLEIGVDLTEAAGLFEERENPLDASDVLSDPVSIEQFRTRLGNYLLVMSYEQSGEGNIQKYLKKLKAKFHGPPLESSVLVPLAGRPQNLPPPCWITPFFTHYREALMALFHSHAKHGLSSEQSKELLQEALHIFGVIASDTAIQQFEASGSLFDFEAAVQLWAARHTGLSKLFVNQLALTRLQFQNLLQKAEGSVRNQLKSLDQELTTLAHKQNKYTKKLTSRALQHVFSFYAKALQSFSAQPSFEEIGHNNDNLTLAKFLKFVRDFDLATKAVADQVFKRLASFSRLMSFSQFVQALEELTQVRTREDLYTKLELSGGYLKKLKGFGLPFRSSKESRTVPQGPRKPFKFKITNYSPSPIKQPEAPPPMKKPVPRKLSPRPREGYAKRSQRSQSEAAPSFVTFRDLQSSSVHMSFDQELLGEPLFEHLYGRQVVPRQLKYLEQQNTNLRRGLSVAAKTRFSQMKA